MIYSAQLFDDNASDHGSILPPAPPNEKPAPREYGSSFTQIATLPSRDVLHARESSGDLRPRCLLDQRIAYIRHEGSPRGGLEVSVEPALEIPSSVLEERPADLQDSTDAPHRPSVGSDTGHGAGENSDGISLATTVVDNHTQR